MLWVQHPAGGAGAQLYAIKRQQALKQVQGGSRGVEATGGREGAGKGDWQAN